MRTKKVILIVSIVCLCTIIGIVIVINNQSYQKSGYEIYFQQLKGDIVVYAGEEYPLNIPFGVKGNIDKFDAEYKELDSQKTPILIDGIRVTGSKLQKAYGNKTEAYYLLSVEIAKEKGESKAKTIQEIGFLDKTKHKIGGINVIYSERKKAPLVVKEATVLAQGFGISEYKATLKNSSEKSLKITSISYGSLDHIPHEITPNFMSESINPSGKALITVNFNAKKDLIGYYLTPKLTYKDSDGKIYESYLDPCQYGISIGEEDIQKILKSFK